MGHWALSIAITLVKLTISHIRSNNWTMTMHEKLIFSFQLGGLVERACIGWARGRSISTEFTSEFGRRS